MNSPVIKSRIFIDTSAMMLDHWSIVWDASLVKLVIASSHNAILPFNMLQELKKHEEKGDLEKASKARSALVWLKRHLDKGGVELIKEQIDQSMYADQLLVMRFAQIASRRHLIAITQDEGLARDLLLLNKMNSFNKYSITVCRINKNAKLGAWSLDPNDPFGRLRGFDQEVTATLYPQEAEPFKMTIGQILLDNLMYTKLIQKYTLISP